jgi:hypothetical protein
VKIIKKIILGIIIFLTTLIISLGTLTALRHDQIANVLIKKVNSSINTKISYSSLKLTLWSAFPDVSVRFKDILIQPSEGYSAAEFVSENSDTLLFASSLSLSVDLFSLISGNIIIKGITVKDGVANLLTDSNGKTNFRVFNKESGSDSNIKLNNISVKGIKIAYIDNYTDITVRGLINNSSVSGEIFGAGIELNTNVSASLDMLQVYGFRFSRTSAEANLTLFKTKTSFTFRKGILKLGELLFSLEGSTDFENKWLDLEIKGQNIDISDIASRLPEKYASYFKGLKPGGIINVGCKVSGRYGSTGVPHFELNYSLSNGRLIYDRSGIDVNNLYLKGNITNGKRNNRQTFCFTVDSLRAALGAAYFSGKFRVENLNQPLISLSLNGDLVFDDLRKFIKTDSFDSREGTVCGNLKLYGRLPAGGKFSLSDLPLLNPTANLRLESFAADFPKMGLFFRGVSGKISLAEHLSAETLCMTILGQKYCFDGVLRNFTSWIAGTGAILDVNGTVNADIFIPSAFAATQTQKQEKNSEEKPLDLFPDDVKAFISFHADSLINNDFHAGNFNCSLSYKPYVLNFNNLSARCLDGSLTGDMLIGRKSDGSYISKTGLSLNGIDIRKAFVSFHNFGQTFIVSKNLGGNLTGNVTILTQLDNKFAVIYPTVVAESHFSILNGKLIDFKPVQELSSFIDLEELKEISFSKLENDLFVRNSTISIPKMQITSSVGGFTVYGTHNFNNDYSYHVRILLSDILSKKARLRNKNNTDFGQVADDGLGRTTVPLKLESKKGKFNVDYDFGQSKEIIQESIVEEKKNLRGILNEEYGWYKEDTVKTQQQQQQRKPKFSISWEEGKEQNAEETASEKNENDSTLHKLFKRKK